MTTTTYEIETHTTTARESAATSAAKPPKAARTPFWDNGRYIAMALVIVGHATLKMIGTSDPAYAVYLFVYLFQVPVFVMISGYFAKSSLPTASDIRKLFSCLIVPYLVFETVWSVIHWAMSGKLSLDYSTAWWTLWFILALVIWRVVLPYLVLLRFPLTISVLLSVGAGYLGNIDDTFSLARAAGLLPFFVLGWKIKQWKLADRWLALPTAIVWRWRAAAIGLFAVVAVVTAVGIDTWRELLFRRFLLYDETYASFGYDQWWAGAVRLGFMALGVVLCFALLMLIPRRETVLTRFGQATLYIYLLHSFVLYPLRQSGLIDGPSDLLLVGLVVGSFALPFALGNRFVQKLFRPVVEPKLDWLFCKRERVATK
ncbi:MAG: hypothetical protein JWN80_653 [Microbacteriaceae bacterium]|nr:hypothetical protein [Microbacteriaceae bacterium]